MNLINFINNSEYIDRKTGLHPRHISEMENDKRPIGKVRAKRLAKALNADYRMFL
jgi:plasmid maintenance system antidote protein VapI